MTEQISSYLSAAVVAGLENVGDFLEAAGDERWHPVAQVAMSIGALRAGRIDEAAFAREVEPLAPALRSVADDFFEVAPKIVEIVGHALTVVDGVRFGFAVLETVPSWAICVLPSRRHPMLEVGHAR